MSICTCLVILATWHVVKTAGQTVSWKLKIKIAWWCAIYNFINLDNNHLPQFWSHFCDPCNICTPPPGWHRKVATRVSPEKTHNWWSLNFSVFSAPSSPVPAGLGSRKLSIFVFLGGLVPSVTMWWPNKTRGFTDLSSSSMSISGWGIYRILISRFLSGEAWLFSLALSARIDQDQKVWEWFYEYWSTWKIKG